MKLEDVRGAKDIYTGKASDVARQLAFAGIAVIWIFRGGQTDQILLPPQLVESLTYFCISLGCDLVQYIVCSIIWSMFNRYREGKRTHSTDDSSFSAPYWINWPANAFFYGKLVAVSYGYLLLLLFVNSRLGGAT